MLSIAMTDLKPFPSGIRRLGPALNEALERLRVSTDSDGACLAVDLGATSESERRLIAEFAGTADESTLRLAGYDVVKSCESAQLFRNNGVTCARATPAAGPIVADARIGCMRLTIVLARGDDRAAYSDAALRMADHWLKMLIRAVEDEILALCEDARRSDRALSRIPEAAAILDKRGDIADVNDAFRAQQAKLAALVRSIRDAAAATRTAHPRGDAIGARFDGPGGALSHLYLLRDVEDDAQKGEQLVILRDPNDALRCCEPRILETIFALTPAEAKLAVALMKFKSLPAAVRSLGLKEKTGRTYLDRIFSKTGAKSQLQLYAILMEVYLLMRAAA